LVVRLALVSDRRGHPHDDHDTAVSCSLVLSPRGREINTSGYKEGVHYTDDY
jgi:hypothetical protein